MEKTPLTIEFDVLPAEMEESYKNALSTCSIHMIRGFGRVLGVKQASAMDKNPCINAILDVRFGRVEAHRSHLGPRPKKDWTEDFIQFERTHGFAVYKNGRYCNFTAPTAKEILEGEESGKTPFSGIINLNNGGNMVDVDLLLPLYSGVWDMQIGLADDCTVEAPVPYKYQTPILFYGSSITQGACASHAGNDYVNTLSRMLDCDIWNLGFSGGAKGEKVIADYMASLDPSIYVLDYDYNAPDPDHLLQTHRPLYQTIRAAHPSTPIVLISKPNFWGSADDYARRDVIQATYQKAVQDGDKNVYFIDGETLFWDEERYACTVDSVHPNDHGFYRMAKVVYPVLKSLLEKTE